MYKIIVFLTLFFLNSLTSALFAQTEWDNGPEDEPKQGIFELQPFQKNHQISVQLPNEGVLTIDFLRLSDWGEKNELQKLSAIAGKQIANIADSFKHASSSKTVALNVPLDEQVISLAYYENNGFGTQLAYKDNEYYQLKTSFDTIRIIRNKAIRTTPEFDSGLVQVGYTFSLKNLEDINSLIADEALMQRIGDSIDTKINLYRKRWRNEDARSHQLSMTYNANKEEAVQVDAVGSSLLPFLRNRFALYLGVGGILFNNQLAPVLDMTFAYVFPSNRKEKLFLGLNAYSFAMFNSDLSPIKQYSAYNVEFGMFKGNRGLMRSKLSLAYGVMFSDMKGDKTMFNMVLNWGVTSYMTVGMNAASTLKFNKNDRGMIAVQLKFNL